MDKRLILNKIQEYYAFAKDGDFASFLGIKQNTLSNWRTRGSIDYDRIISKCDKINGHWLLTGEGEMIKEANKLQGLVAEFDVKEKLLLEMQISGLKKENELQSKTINLLNELNAELKYRIATLEKELAVATTEAKRQAG